MKAILDSSVLISAFLTRGGSPGEVLAAGLDGRFELVLSEPLRVPTKPAGYSRFFVILGASVRRAAKTA